MDKDHDMSVSVNQANAASSDDRTSGGASSTQSHNDANNRTENTGVPNLLTVLTKLDQMSLKMDNMATKEDLRQHMDETKVLISRAVDPLKDEIADVRDQFDQFKR